VLNSSSITASSVNAALESHPAKVSMLAKLISCLLSWGNTAEKHRMSLASASFTLIPPEFGVDSRPLIGPSLLSHHLDVIPFGNDTLVHQNIVRAMNTKIDEVKALFESPRPYLERRRYNINIRAESVQYFLRNRRFIRILDVGCGDGSASIPLLSTQKSLTLLDLSKNMLSIAFSNVPPELKQNVQPINQDFLSANLEPRSFDLIICLGLLAHVDSPKDVINKIAQLLRPNGVAIMQSTDSGGLLTRLGVSYRRVLEAFGRVKYRYTLTTTNQVVQMFAACGLELSEIYRYSLPSLPGIDRIISQRALYNYVRLAHGPAQNNYNTWPGKECIYLFTPTNRFPSPHEFAPTASANQD
jgi:2-polyprenyl-3-methyl-5-hydroxy-6-metoxy-1,4-benzoquinol methylase